MAYRSQIIINYNNMCIDCLYSEFREFLEILIYESNTENHSGPSYPIIRNL